MLSTLFFQQMLTFFARFSRPRSARFVDALPVPVLLGRPEQVPIRTEPQGEWTRELGPGLPHSTPPETKTSHLNPAHIVIESAICNYQLQKIGVKKRPIYKGLQALFNNLTIKKVKLFTDIKVKIIIENIVFVVFVVYI